MYATLKLPHSLPKELSGELRLRKSCPRLRKKVSSGSILTCRDKLTVTILIIIIVGDIESVEKFQKRLVSKSYILSAM